MFKNYFKAALRNIRKNKVHSFIGIFGLALAVGVFTLPYLIIDLHNNHDTFHKNYKEIYYVENRLGKSGAGKLYGLTQMPLGPAMKKDFPQVTDYVRVIPVSPVIKIADKLYKQNVYFVDDNFLDVFTFPIVIGDKDALSYGNNVVITDRCAEKYFGDENPIGKEIIISNEDDFREPFFVKGVVKRPPERSSLQFDILIPFEKLKSWDNTDFNDWSLWTHTFIRLKNREAINALQKQRLNEYIQFQNKAENSFPVQSYHFELLSDMAKNSYRVNNDLGRGYHPATIIGLTLFGVLILLIACFDYINIGIVTASRRLTEIGIRKVIGGSRFQLIIQFLGEHFIICSAAIILGAIFASTCVVPFYNMLFNAGIKMNLLHDYKLWIFYGFTLLLTVVASGSYPAIYVSRFKPMNILRKTHSVGGGSKISKVFLAIQFIITFIIIGVAVIFIQNAKYQESIDWGYDQDQVIVVKIDGRKHYEIFKNSISQNPNIISIGGSQHHIGKSWTNCIFEYHGEEYTSRALVVGHDYLSTMKFRLKKGRIFDRNMVTDNRSIVINDKLTRSMGWQSPVGEKVEINNEEYTIIGVVEDFNQEPFTEPIKPVVFHLCDPKDFRYLSVRVAANNMVHAAGVLENTWKRLFPNDLYQVFYQDRIWEWHFRINEGIYQLSLFIAFISLAISCTGLFGLINISILKRMKEVSIRKVLGASITTIVKILNESTLKIMITSSIIGIPLCYLLMDWFLDFSYNSRTAITVAPFLIATIAITSLSLLTVLSQTIKAARTNIVDNLKEE